jgi:hypothetical protein
MLAATWVWTGLLLLAFTLLLLDAFAPEVARTISSQSIRSEKGHAFVVRIPDELLFAARGSTADTRVRRKLTLFENGYPLGPADVPHGDVREKGGGAYSHWGNSLYFSLRDATDPRTNGRAYSYRVPTALHPALRFAAYGAIVVAAVVVAGGSMRRRGDSLVGEKLLRYLGVIATASGVLGLAYLSAVLVTTGARQGVLDPGTISAQRGHAYMSRIELAIGWPLRAAAAPGSFDPASSLTFVEDGVPLGPIEPDPTVLERNGSGRHALFADQLLFSTSDDSDPRTNGRAYAWLVPVEVMPSAWLLPLLASVIGLLLASGRAAPLVAEWFVRVSAAEHRGRSAIVPAVIVVLVCLAAVALVVIRWNWGPSAHLGFMGYLPVSDAMGYFWCAAVAAGGAPVGASPLTPDLAPLAFDWCARRVLYVTTLGAALGLSGWRPQLVLLTQGLLVGGALAAFALTVARSYGRMAAIVSLGGLFLVAYDLALGAFMTEVLGLVLGLLGIALLLDYARGQGRLSLLYAGLASISFAMFARMGALLILPTLGLWACWVIYRSARPRRLGACAGVVIALAAGPILQFLMVLALGVDPANTGGNYATTLYGLSTGSRNWTQAYRDFASLFASSSETVAFAKVYAAAFTNIRENPSVFAQSLAIGTMSYLVDAFSVGAVLFRFNAVLSVLCLVGVVWCALHSTNRLASLPLVVLLGEFLSVPLVFTGASDHRVLIVSVGVRFLVAGIGVAWLWSAGLALVISSGRRFDITAGTGHETGIAPATALGVVLVLVATLLATPIQRVFALPSVAGRGCPDSQQELVARVGRESMAVSIGPGSNLLDIRALALSPAQLRIERGRRDVWWTTRLPQLRTGTTLIYAIQLLPNAHGSLVPLIFDGDLPGESDSLVSFCYDPTPTAVAIGDVPFRRVITAKLLASS